MIDSSRYERGLIAESTGFFQIGSMPLVMLYCGYDYK
jgi:hypothetical protein